MPKTNSKKTTTNKKTKPVRKEEVQVREIPSPVKIVYQKDMGFVELSDNKGIVVSLIRNALEQRYISIQRVSKAKSGDWKSDGGKIWLPFSKMEDIGNLISYAYDEGVKAGWNINYESQPMNMPQGNILDSAKDKPALRELELVSDDPYLNQLRLFDTDKKG